MFPSSFGCNISIEERRKTTELWKEDLRKMSLTVSPSFMDVLQAARKDVLATAHRIHGLEPLHSFQLGMSKLSKEFPTSYLGSEALLSHPKKPFHERRSLGRMPKSI